MRLLPEKYTDIEKSLPLLITTNEPLIAYYTSPITKQRKSVKVPKGSTFSISAIPDKIYAQGEDVFVNSDLVVIRGVTAGKKARVYGQFKYSDLIKSSTIANRPSAKYAPATKSLLIFGLPRKTFFVGLGTVMVIAGIYYIKKGK
jgi:hypothetical protein